MNVSSVQERLRVYKELRRLLIEQGTAVANDDHQSRINKNRFQEQLKFACESAHLDLDLEASRVWRILWAIPRYAYARADYVSQQDVPSLQSIPDLSSWELMASPAWLVEGDYRHAVPNGEKARLFCKGAYNTPTRSYNRAAHRLLRLTKTAQFLLSHASIGMPPLRAMFPKYDGSAQSVIEVHRKLATILGKLTALHVMMELGFPVVKPDRWLTRIVISLGWLEPLFLRNMTRAAIDRIYGSPKCFWAAINMAAELAHALETEALYGNALREIDLVLVKYGQDPEVGWGLVRRMEDVAPAAKIQEALVAK
jgi:hypothetical protein